MINSDKKVYINYIMGLKSLYSKLCPPARLYVWISIASLVLLFLGNIKNPYEFTVGSYTAPLTFNNMFLTVLQAFYAIIWTWILNKFCDVGWTPVSWLLVLFPLLLGVVLMGIFLYAMIESVKRQRLQEEK